MVSTATFHHGFVFLVLCGLEVVAQFRAPTDSPTNATTLVTVMPTVMSTFSPTINSVDSSNTPAPTLSPANATIYETGLDRGLRVVELLEVVGSRPLLEDPTVSLTLLAPVNAAFDALHPKIFDYIMSRGNVVFLRYILEGHVFQGSLSSSALRETTELTAENGFTSRVQVSTNNDILVEFARVLTADIRATNGVIHITDSLVNAPTLLQALPQFMKEALVVAGLLGDPIWDGATFFMPSLFAFAGLSAINVDLSDSILTDPSFALHLKELIRAHIVPDIVFSSQFQDGDNVTIMDNGDVFVVSMDAEEVSLSPGLTNGKAAIIEDDVLTVRTVIHHVDGVLYASFLSKTLVDVAAEHVSTLASLVVSSGLDSLLSTTFNVTGMFLPVLLRRKGHAPGKRCPVLHRGPSRPNYWRHLLFYRLLVAMFHNHTLRVVEWCGRSN